MTDIDIYDLAANVLSSITSDLNHSHYNELHGKLTISYSTKKEINASASVLSSPDQPPSHNIDISYLLLKTLYRDIELYFEYMESKLDDNLIMGIWPENNFFQNILSLTPKNDCIKNVFISAISWVYFHEFGHLSQEHGRIRGLHKGNRINVITEMYVTGDSTLSPQDSAVWHLTELAADYFATIMCVNEIRRHFGPSEVEQAITYLTIGLPLVLFRFQNTSFYINQDPPSGTHPNPLTRLEVISPLIYEFLSEKNTDERKIIVNLCGVSTFSVSLFWTRIVYKEPKYPHHFILSGIVNRNDILEYLSHLIPVWDNISKEVHNSFTFAPKFFIITFTNELRKHVKMATPPN